MVYEEYEKMRQQTGLSNSAIAKKAGIPRSTFSDWKSGRSKPKEEKLGKILAVLYSHAQNSEYRGIDAAIEITRISRNIQNATLEPDVWYETEDGKAIIEVLKAMNPKQISKAKKVLDIIADEDEV